MNIVIIGDGKVGYSLSENLNKAGHAITIIDNNAETLNATLDMLDVMGIHGNGASLDVQMEAGVPDADLLIAATSRDELNLLCCLTAKNLGAKRTIARVRNPEYATQLKMLKEQFGLSMVINPELEAAKEIARVIRFPQALRIDTFAKGRVELVEYKLRENMPVIGKKLMDLTIVRESKVLICAVERDENVVIPDGHFVLQAGDRIHISGTNQAIADFLGHLSEMKFRVRSVMIVGGGRITYYLVKMLDENKDIQIKIIEKNRERCDELCEWMPRVTIIHGDGAELDLLEAEGMRDVDAFVALTNMDEENLIMSMMASYRKVPKVITKTGRFNYISVMEKIGIDTVVNPKLTTSNQIVQYVRAMQNSENFNHIITLYKMVDGKAEAAEFFASGDTRNLGVPLDQLRLKRNLLIAVIVRQDKVIIPHGKDCIMQGDSVVVLTNEHKLSHLNDIYADQLWAK